MSERTRKQKDADPSAKEEQTYGTRNEEGTAGFKVADIRYPDAGANLAPNPGTGEPTVSPTSQGPGSEGSENGFVDAPGSSGSASSGEADARRDASPDQRANLLKQIRSQGTQ